MHGLWGQVSWLAVVEEISASPLLFVIRGTYATAS